jgi:pimeloyl-ACP methyl ester carboxylesterase
LIHGGAANWYEFFLDPMNGPGLAQYLAQKTSVVLVTIPGNYRPGGWPEPIVLRAPQFLLDRELPGEENKARNAMLTFTLIAEGVAQLVEKHVPGPLLIVGHSTGGEIQFLLKERLRAQLRGLSLGWGTGGPAHVRRGWDDESKRSREASPSITTLRYRDPKTYARNYVGPLNPVPGTTPVEVAEGWFARESRRRPQFKQVLQDVEHRGETAELPRMRGDLARAVASAGLPVDTARVVADYFSTMRTGLAGYRRMVSNSGSGDQGHWAQDPAQAREVALARRFRAENPRAEIRVLAYETPMTHYGHIERPRALAAALLAGARWLAEVR